MDPAKAMPLSKRLCGDGALPRTGGAKPRHHTSASETAAFLNTWVCAIQVRDFAEFFLNLALFPHFDPQGNSNRICFPLNISKRIIRIRRFIPL